MQLSVAGPRRIAAAILVVLFFSGGVHAQEFARVGNPAPALATAKLTQAPPGSRLTWESLRGKAVVLEFWATWCAGCVAHIPKLDRLAESFKDRPVVFMSLSQESEGTVSLFLQRYPINGWVVSETPDSVWKAYRVQGIPKTVLVDPNGILKGITDPNAVNEAMVEDLVGGKDLNLPRSAPSPTPIFGTEPGAPPPLINVLLRPAAPVEISHYSPGAEEVAPGSYRAWGISLRDLIAEAYGFAPSRTDAPSWCSTTLYDVAVSSVGGSEQDRWNILQDVLESAFHLKLHQALRDTPVYVLKTIPGQESTMRISGIEGTNSRPWGGKGELDARGVGTATIVGVASAVLQSEVFDETGLTAKYDFDLKWNRTHPESIVSAVRDQLGLALVPGRRKLKYLILDNIEQPKMASH